MCDPAFAQDVIHLGEASCTQVCLPMAFYEAFKGREDLQYSQTCQGLGFEDLVNNGNFWGVDFVVFGPSDKPPAVQPYLGKPS